MVKTSKFQFKWNFIIRVFVVNSLAFSLVNSVEVGLAITEALILTAIMIHQDAGIMGSCSHGDHHYVRTI